MENEAKMYTDRCLSSTAMRLQRIDIFKALCRDPGYLSAPSFLGQTRETAELSRTAILRLDSNSLTAVKYLELVFPILSPGKVRFSLLARTAN